MALLYEIKGKIDVSRAILISLQKELEPFKKMKERIRNGEKISDSEMFTLGETNITTKVLNIAPETFHSLGSIYDCVTKEMKNNQGADALLHPEKYKMNK